MPERGIYLRAYYFDNRNRIWGLFCTTFALFLFSRVIGAALNWSVASLQLSANYVLASVIGLALSIVSLSVRSVWWHRIGVIALMILLPAVYGPMRWP